MRIRNYFLLILFVGTLGLVTQNTAAQDDYSHTNPLHDVSITLPDLPEPEESLPVKADTVPVKTNAVDAPVYYAAKDSMIMEMKGRNMVYMYGSGSVQYKNLDLKGEYIEVDAGKSTVYATFAMDSIGEEFGYPIFKEGETEYEMKKARYNFKTKKMYISDVITQQGEGFMTAGRTKKMPNDDLFTENARYTTCDNHEAPHFYINLTKAKVRPGKNIVTGPAYLVVEDVPLPVAVPFGFFPFTKNYSSGIIMPTYGDELRRGFSLQHGGYYFALSDHFDLALTGELFTRGSWGLEAASKYTKRYKFSGSFNVNYLVTVLGEKWKTGDGTSLETSDYSKSKDMSINWTHSQDAKANPFGTFSANVRFSTSSYNKNQRDASYSGQATQNTASSTVNYSYRIPDSPFSFTSNASITQTKRDTSLSVTFPTLVIAMRQIYPFQRKDRVGAPKWYEKINMSYSGSFSNNIQKVHENDFFKKNLVKDWKNGMKHSVPIQASFSLLKNIKINPSAAYNAYWYTNKITKEYDYAQQKIVPKDTIYGFYHLQDFNGGISASTKLYGMYKPWGIFGEWTKKTIIRHVLTPSLSYSGRPYLGDKKYGYYYDLTYINEKSQERVTESYSPFEHHGTVPSRTRAGSLSFSLENNLEMKVPIAGSDSTRKISLIDQFSLNSGWNFLADSLNLSDIGASLRLKLLKNYTLSLSGRFDVYKYNEEGRPINVLRWQKGGGQGKSFPRFQGMSQTISYSLNNESLKKLFGKEKKTDTNNDNGSAEEETEVEETTGNREKKTSQTSLRKPKEKDANYDDDGYYLINIPWNLNLNYTVGFGYDRSKFNKNGDMEYPYMINHNNLGISGNISPTKGWNFHFSTGYDFKLKTFTYTTLRITRQMHCWTMSASVIPVGYWQSYSFTIAVNSSLLQDLKYSQSSSSRDAVNWAN